MNAVDSMQCGLMEPDIMQWIPGSMLECSGFYAEWCNVSRLNEVDTMQLGVIDTDGMQWIPCSVAECTGVHAAV